LTRARRQYCTVRFARSLARALGWTAFAVACVSTAVDAGGLPACPPTGGNLRVSALPPAATGPAAVVFFGNLDEPTCEGALATGYARLVLCDPAVTGSCEAPFSALQPGRWSHRVLVIGGAGEGQLQGRRALLLAAAAGENAFSWPLFASVTTVSSLIDSPTCTGCLRAAIAIAEGAAKPALVQFALNTVGTVVLAAPLPPLAAGRVTLDGFDPDGRPQRRTVDGNGLNAAALRITGADNTVAGLRVVNAGGNSDVVLIDGSAAVRNRLESLQVVGRSLIPCGADQRGCLIDGICRTVETDPPLGACGDDGIAARGGAGLGGENVVFGCEVMGAFDKGIKISNGAFARVERSSLHDNADGGLQATLGGSVLAVENVAENNHGTASANGLAANGPEGGVPPAAVLETQGNLVRGNALRGISVRSLSEAVVRDDHVCGNGAPASGGFGIAVLDAAGLSANASVQGTAVVHNTDGGVVVGDSSTLDLGGLGSAGDNALAFNGPPAASRANLQNLTAFPVSASNDQWESCGGGWRCDVAAVLDRDVLQSPPLGTVAVEPAQPPRARAPLEITAVSPPFAAAGELVRVYGKGFDAIEGNAPDGGCEDIPSANRCDPPSGNCVVVDGQPADVVAVTPTMLVLRAPFSCVAPVRIEIRNRHARGIARATFCQLP
jgi:hypothetical protein